jgi:hypothetical protein
MEPLGERSSNEPDKFKEPKLLQKRTCVVDIVEPHKQRQVADDSALKTTDCDDVENVGGGAKRRRLAKTIAKVAQ